MSMFVKPFTFINSQVEISWELKPNSSIGHFIASGKEL